MLDFLQSFYNDITFVTSNVDQTYTVESQTSLEPWKFVRDTSNSSHWGLIMASGQEINGDNLGNSILYPAQ